ncbi:MAG: chromosomal replication initiator protein DnaA [Candidatus Neomarinimicrobiota bacterium]|nr:MAG: chromosomal replication initiator protein DnaA [Candidatus Neomarinimicrobiota bacterium]
MEIWSKTKELLKERLTEHAYNTWFEPVQCIAENGSELVLEVPNQFFYEWIESHYRPTLDTIFRNDFHLDLSIKYTVSPETVVTPVYQDDPPSQPERKKLARPFLNKNYTFATFIEGSNNQFARAAAFNVAETPGTSAFNPLVIYGGVGLGKTHLLHAIGNHILATRPNLRVLSASSEKFTQDFIASIQKNKTIEFSRYYRKADVLLIDDIQFFQRKEQTQEQFFHTFNALYQAGKQIVLTADQYPGEMKGLQERLLSRFQSGLAVDIQPPDFETRVAILLEKAEMNGLELPYTMIEYMATHIKDNIRELESTIIRLLATSSLFNRDIDMDLVQKVVAERVGKQVQTDLSFEQLVRYVSEATHVTEREILGHRRTKHIAEARQLAMYLSRELTQNSLTAIGLYFGGRDHTTVMHACQKMEKQLQEDPRLRNLIHTAKRELTRLPLGMPGA